MELRRVLSLGLVLGRSTRAGVAAVAASGHWDINSSHKPHKIFRNWLAINQTSLMQPMGGFSYLLWP